METPYRERSRSAGSFAVAIVELAGTVAGQGPRDSHVIDAEAAALAADVGISAYDARLLLAQGTPAVVRSTPDRALALDLLGRLRARGHEAVACDTSAVVASSAMVSMRRFRLGSGAIELDDRPDETLPYDDVLALVAAVHRTTTNTETHSRQTKLSVGRAIMTSGLSMTKTVHSSSRSSAEHREQVLYLFRRSAATPWFLRERGTRWSGHGRPLASSEVENFRHALAALRQAVPAAAFDDRLVSRKVGERASISGTPGGSHTVTTSSDATIDLLAHLLGAAIARRSG